MTAADQHSIAFRGAMEAAGIHFTGEVVPDGRIHRFHVDGDRPGSRNGWFVLHVDGRAAGAFGTWKEAGQQRVTWVADRGSTQMSAEERRALREKIAADKRARAEAIAEAQSAAAVRAAAIWEGAAEATDDHPYLVSKGVRAHGLRVGTWVIESEPDEYGEIRETKIKNTLLIPIKEGKALVGLQGIFPSAKNPLKRGKDYQRDIKKAGCYFVIGKPVDLDGQKTAILCEGYSTGATIHEDTGLFVVVCFDAGNLDAVARKFREHYPDWRLVIACDNDLWTKKPVDNPGVTAGRKAAFNARAVTAIPQFRKEDLEVKPTDFNDLGQLQGHEEVKRQIMAAIFPPKLPEPAEPGADTGRRGHLSLVANNDNPQALQPPRRRPDIEVIAGELETIVDAAEQAVIENCPEIFQRGEMLVRPATVKIDVVDGGQIDGIRLISVDQPHLVERMTSAARFLKWDGRKDMWLKIDCPQQIATTYLARKGLWRLPRLAGVISAPTLRDDGSILDKPGYDQASKLLFHPGDVDFGTLPEYPDQEDALLALAELKNLISTFPFVTDADRSVALSGLLTPLVRRSLPAAPLHAFTAPTPGSGKSMLVDIAAVLATGRQAPVISQGATEEEMEKRLGACLLAGDTLITIDNCAGAIEGDFLCQVMTQPSLKIRVLGRSVTVETPSGAAMFATGNNLRVVGDMTRRTVMARLDPGVENPELRQFAFDPVYRARTGRVGYVRAGLTILRAYHVARRPTMALPLGSFGPWSNLIRSALLWLGEADPCATMDEVRKTDDRRATISRVLTGWEEHFGNQRMKVRDVIAAANNDGGDFRDALLTVADDRGNINSRRLGHFLGSIEGRFVSGLRIDRAAKSNGDQLWQLARAS